MRVLIVGNGGRESALAVKLKEDGRISKLYFAKGNATTDKLGQNVYEDDVVELRKFALKERIDLTIVGPEAPLVDGIVDEFHRHGLTIFGAKKTCGRTGGKQSLLQEIHADAPH